MSNKPNGIPTPRPTARAFEFFFVAEEAVLEGAVLAVTVTVARAAAAAADDVWALGSARPMPSFGLPGSWLSRRRMPTRLLIFESQYCFFAGVAASLGTRLESWLL